MNLARVIADAMQGRLPRRREHQPGVASGLSPQEFLKGEVWPIFRETRQALDARGINAVALQPAAGDTTHSFTLLILDSNGDAEHACFLRFLVHNQRLHVRVKHPRRNDEQPVLLEPAGSVVLVQDIIEDFLYECLTPTDVKRKTSPQAEKSRPGAESLHRISELSAVH